jgi:hypothetical protein
MKDEQTYGDDPIPESKAEKTKDNNEPMDHKNKLNIKKN